MGLEQISDPAKLTPIIQTIIAAHPSQAQEYRNGQSKRLGFFVGQVMRETQGKANLPLVNKLLIEELGKSS